MSDENSSERLGYLDKFARQLLTNQLLSIRGGEIVLSDYQGCAHFGERGDIGAVCSVRRPRFYRDALFGGTLSIAQSYIDGDWDCDDLTSLFRILVRNIQTTTRLDNWFSGIISVGHRILHWTRKNSLRGSRKNISAHYDLGNDFFRLWLDQSLAYSSGIFPHAHATMHDASIEKFDRICRKLDLSSDDEVLEIGAGWGGFAIHAAQHYDCRITTTTISKEQFEVARDRIHRAKLNDRITLLQKDYRELTGKYDKIVSIEMIEAVGHQFLDDYFKRCNELLKPDGSLALQAIVMPESRHREYLRSVDFIQRFVFPGGSLPSVSSLLESIGRTSDLRLVHIEELAPHYAKTLHLWKRSFEDQIDAVKEQGFPDPFIRMWNYYLSYCEALFEERHIGVMQLQFDRQQGRQDPIRISSRAAMMPEEKRDMGLSGRFHELAHGDVH
ncbi:cyclopropane-fatty-acyl-phospholipid synthase family protein [bacterium]|nr:cyclopropane-fatty-acyl-phospholipid synthase family protein [bacterium]